MAKIVVGLFDAIDDARMAVSALKDEGFRPDDISLVAGDKAGKYSTTLGEGRQGAIDTAADAGNTAADAADGAATGAGVGAVMGGLGGLLLGLGALAIPGIGPVVAAGPLIAALAGAGIGAAAGGLVGALVDAGVPEEHARNYTEGVRRGGSLVTVRVSDDNASRAVAVLNRFNPVDVDRRSEEWNRNPVQEDMPQQGDLDIKPYATTMDSSTRDTSRLDANRMDTNRMDTNRMETRHEDGVILPVVEEELKVGKREVDTGGVHVETNVTEKPVEETVNLRRENVNVERRPVDRTASDKDFDAFKEGSLDINTKAEEVVVDKQARVVEEVHVTKEVEEHPETVRDTLRRQDVDVEHLDQNRDASHFNSTMSGYNEFEPIWRNHYQGMHSTSGYTYDDYAPAYQYGYTMANDERYRNRQWQDVEMDARRDWESQHPQNAWESFKDAIQQGWETVTGRSNH